MVEKYIFLNTSLIKWNTSKYVHTVVSITEYWLMDHRYTLEKQHGLEDNNVAVQVTQMLGKISTSTSSASIPSSYLKIYIVDHYDSIN